MIIVIAGISMLFGLVFFGCFMLFANLHSDISDTLNIVLATIMGVLITAASIICIAGWLSLL